MTNIMQVCFSCLFLQAFISQKELKLTKQFVLFNGLRKTHFQNESG